MRVIPHEPELRAWLRRSRIEDSEADEIVQEAYCRLAALPEVDHIDHPRAYFFSIAKNLLVRRLRRADVVPIEALAEIETMDPSPDPESAVAAQLMREQLERFIEELPDRCRRILKMRKLQGMCDSNAHTIDLTSLVSDYSPSGFMAPPAVVGDFDRLFALAYPVSALPAGSEQLLQHGTVRLRTAEAFAKFGFATTVGTIPLTGSAGVRIARTSATSAAPCGLAQTR